MVDENERTDDWMDCVRAWCAAYEDDSSVFKDKTRMQKPQAIKSISDYNTCT